MTWNFDYTIPSLIGLIFFLIFYLLKPVLLSRSNKIFCSIVIVEIVGFAITCFSSYADNNSVLFNRNFLIILNSLYYLMYVARYILFSLFFCTLLKVKFYKDIPTIITAFTSLCITVIILINPWTGFIYTLADDGRFQSAKYYSLIYYANFITLVLDFYYIIRFHKKLQVKGLICSIFSVLALFACGLMDNIYIDYLISDMFFLFVILILFMCFENPDYYLDNKTGLYNYQAFSYVVKEYLFRNKKYSIITFIIKNYPEKKQIYGVKQTDSALYAIGKFFQNTFHNKKCFYLLNGKFAIIDNNTKDFPLFCDKIVKRFEQPWHINNYEVNLNIFIVDMAEDISFKKLEDIYAGYGIAYAEAKKMPCNRVTINKKTYNDIIRKTLVTKALNKALLGDCLQVYMQPIVEASSRKIVAAEALVRIIDDELGVIPPIEFINLAEKNGSIEQLGEQVLNKVCIYLNTSHIQEHGIKWINVNLSPVQCQNYKLPEKIENIIKINTIDQRFIHLEITEDSLIDSQILKMQMNILIANGYKFSLDDFGSGFSNVNRVKSFPFNNIKLDMSIIWEHFSSPDNMLPSIIKTFNDRGLSVTAEGVETKEMADSLQEMGCKYLQGFYFSKPIPMDEFEKFVLQHDN